MKLIHLYYNPKTGEIKSASPVAMEEFADLGCHKIPFDDGLKFLTGEYSLNEWFIVGKPGECVLTNNPLDIPPLHSGNIFMVPRARHSFLFNGLSAVVFLASDLIEFSIPEKYKGRRLKAIKEKELTFYLTKRNDPEHVVKELTVPVRKLITDGSVKIKLELNGEFTDFSLLTPRVFSQYRFEVIKSVWFQQTTNASAKINNLVAFKQKTTVGDDEKCILATYLPESRRITLQLKNNADVAGFDGMQGLVFLTAPRDPTVILHHYVVDISTLVNGSVIELPLPKNIQGNFGMGGAPLSENLYFVKQQ